MTVLLVHAVAASARAAQGLPFGHGEHPLQLVAAGPLAGYATCWDVREPPRLDSLLAHHRLVESLSLQVPCLPVRFGAWVEDETVLRDLLLRRAAPLLDTLERVRSRREVAVTALWRHTSPSAAAARDVANSAVFGGAGRRFLEGRRQFWREHDAQERRAGELARELEQALGVEPARARHQRCPSDRVALSSALLVDAEAVSAAVSAVTRLGEGWPDVTVQVGGPWPPYSFVELPL